MASAQEMLASTSNMQQDAQAALPVIPNNGNPNGAYNMPQGTTQAPAKKAGPDLSWLQPSAYMGEVNNVLQSMQKRIDQSTPIPGTDLQPTQDAAAVQNAMETPVLPMRAMSAPSGVVLPQTG